MMEKPYPIIVMLLFLIGYGLAACQTHPFQPTLFDTSPCKAPCWENVTPGVTTKGNALAIFAKFADQQGVIDRPSQTPYYEDDIIFGPPNSGTIFADTLNGRILAVQFQGEFGGPLTVQHAIELFGEPESVLVEYGAEHYEVILLNPTKGIAVGWIITGFAPMTIDPNSRVTLVWFFDPNQYGPFLNARYNGHGDEEKQKMVPWSGYGNIDDKYRPSATP